MMDLKGKGIRKCRALVGQNDQRLMDKLGQLRNDGGRNRRGKGNSSMKEWIEKTSSSNKRWEEEVSKTAQVWREKKNLKAKVYMRIAKKEVLL